MSTRSTRGLGVPKRAVMRWDEQGLMKAVLLPGGVRRLPPEDVGALRQQMFGGFPEITPEDDLVPVRVHPIED